MKTTSAEIRAVIDNFATYRDELLRALDHPGLPLHNNLSFGSIYSSGFEVVLPI